MCTECEREKKVHQDGRNELNDNSLGNERKWIVQILYS